MLIEFSVENYLSFKEKVTLSLEASKDKECPNNVIRSAQGTNFDLLKTIIIYGANASGKSNLFKALHFMRYFVLESAKEHGRTTLIDTVPFKLAKKWDQKPSTFEVMFLSNGIRYLYGFSVTEKKVVEEWLYSYPHNRRRLLFDRKSETGDYNIDYNFGGKWKGEGSRLAKITRSNALFISVASQFNNPIAEKIDEWFRFQIRGVMDLPMGESEEWFTKMLCFDEPEFKEMVLAIIKNADLGIKEINISKIDHNESKDLKKLPIKIRKPAEEGSQDKEIEDETLDVSFVHSGLEKDGTPCDVIFSPFEESDGTKKYFAIAGPILHVLFTGCCLLADELDVKLHPLLTKGIIELFHSEDLNISGAQLICAIHDINLLSLRNFLRRDQIWFTARRDTGETELYSAWDYKIRKGERLDRGYLAGRYGAIPFVDKLL
jgi:AAA15 family ATPase/GTPase